MPWVSLITSHNAAISELTCSLARLTARCTWLCCATTVSAFSFSILGYCLMTNHVHLIGVPRTRSSLAKRSEGGATLRPLDLPTMYVLVLPSRFCRKVTFFSD